MKERVIAKYNPEYYDENGIYTKNEWDCFDDIGKIYDYKRLTFEDYYIVETNYVGFVLECLELVNCKYLTIDWNLDFEKKYFRRAIKDICHLDLTFNEDECLSLISEIETRQRVSVQKSILLLRLMLRNAFNVSLCNKRKKIRFYMGYEYYLHFFTSLEKEVVKAIAEKHNLYLLW
ncbi:MAG: hypothetical protein MJZ03_06835 [archaeon]|nr:hypothetical protein [archaeon]